MWLNDHSGLPFKDQVAILEPWHMIFKFMIREGSLSQESKTAVHWLLGDAVGWEGHCLYQDCCALLSRGGQTWHFYRCIFLVSRLEAWKRNITKRFDGDQAFRLKVSAELAYSHGSRCVSPEKLPDSPLLIILERRNLIFLNSELLVIVKAPACILPLPTFPAPQLRIRTRQTVPSSHVAVLEVVAWVRMSLTTISFWVQCLSKGIIHVFNDS